VVSTADASVTACCFHTNSPPSRFIDNDLGTNTDWGWADNSASNMSSWPEILKNPLSGGAGFNNTECGTGHPSVFLSESLPVAIRRHAHCFTLDLGRVVNNIADAGFCARDTQRFPHEFEVFYSNSYIGPIPGPAAVSLGVFTRAGDISAGNWENYNLHERTADGRPFSARYIHVRVYRTRDTGGPGGRIDFSVRQFRVRTGSD